ncbi:MAG: MFS transporter, partial [Micrococcales bacterium]
EHVPFNFRARALAVLGGTFRAGGFLGPLLGAAVVSLFDVQAAFAVSAVVCLLSALVLMVQKDDSHSKPDPAAKTSLRHVTKRELPKLASIGTGAALLVFVRTSRQIGLPLWGIFLGMHPAQISLYIGIAGAVDFALFYTSGQIIDRFGRRWSIVPTMTALGIGMIAMVLATSPSLFLTLAVCLSIANALSSGIILTLGADLAPKDGRNEFLAAFRMMCDAGGAASPLAVSALTAAFSLPVAFVVVGIVSIGGAFGLWHYLPKFGIR